MPKSRLNPRLAKMAEKRARSEHQVMSAANARPNPAPTATPSTLAMTGTGHWCTARTTSPSTRIASSWLPGTRRVPSPPPLPPPPRSAPAQKSPPAPVSTTARAPDQLRSRNVAPIATHMSPVQAFFDPGRSMVTVVT